MLSNLQQFQGTQLTHLDIFLICFFPCNEASSLARSPARLSRHFLWTGDPRKNVWTNYTKIQHFNRFLSLARSQFAGVFQAVLFILVPYIVVKGMWGKYSIYHPISSIRQISIGMTWAKKSHPKYGWTQHQYSSVDGLEWFKWRFGWWMIYVNAIDAIDITNKSWFDWKLGSSEASGEFTLPG